MSGFGGVLLQHGFGHWRAIPALADSPSGQQQGCISWWITSSLEEPFSVATDCLPLSFRERGSFHYRSLTLPVSINKMYDTWINFSSWHFRVHRTDSETFLSLFPGLIFLGTEYLLHLFAMSVGDSGTLLPFWGWLLEVGALAPIHLVTSWIRVYRFTLKSSRVTVE